MKKSILLLAFVFVLYGCSDKEESCKCTGKFRRFNMPGYFYAKGVDCQTGQPVLDQQNQGLIGKTNPAIYVGCNE